MTQKSADDIFKKQFDVVVIGAGINGAGIARDAAMRGLKVLLLDKGDIGGGTSSWSTRLIHGGLRYLEHGEFGLVRESLRERAYLMNIAPHLVRPLAMLVPVYKNARRGIWTLRAGMMVYDALSSDKKAPRHRMLSRTETLQQAPDLNREGLLGAAIYFDAQVEFAERLVLENVLDAVAHGGTVVTYARVDKLNTEKENVSSVEFTNLLTRENHSASAKIVINAAGPWIDKVLDEGVGNSPRLIGGTKGSHVIVGPFAGAPKTAIYVEAETDQRPFFIIPWNGNYLIGTTDIRYDGDLDNIQIDQNEIDYLLRETNRAIPKARLTREHILYSYSGIRPLPFVNEKDEQSITRKHFIRQHPHSDNLFSIVGGKLTTYRGLAEQTIDLVFKKLRRRPARCTTARKHLPGAAAPDYDVFCTDFRQHSSLPKATNDRLLRIYGTRSTLILDLVEKEPSLAESFDSETGAIAAEVVFSFKQELAERLTDCLLRRTMVGLNSSSGLNAVEAAAYVACKHLGWSEVRAEEEIAAYREEVRRRFRNGCQTNNA